ncbi:hypothetical protein, partial [Mesorhizobium sp. M0571]|uniref:hypothetical protein n=1 Tax=Mesorhizobium sp. M0571 TaxID=2956960 RepID=UPI00333A740B
ADQAAEIPPEAAGRSWGLVVISKGMLPLPEVPPPIQAIYARQPLSGRGAESATSTLPLMALE